MSAARCYVAEFIGTAMLVLTGVGTAVLAPKAGPIGIALAFGLTLLVLAYALGPISGCHINPAVTLGVVIAGRLSVRHALGYVIAQVLGGIAGAALVYAVASNRSGYHLSSDGLGANGWGHASSGGYGMTAAIVAELALTFLLVYTVLSVTETPSSATVAGIPIGIALLVAHLVAVPIDGTSVNPARSIGPALFVGDTATSQLWLFIVFPLLAGVLAAIVYRVLSQHPTNQTRHDDSTSQPAAAS